MIWYLHQSLNGILKTTFWDLRCTQQICSQTLKTSIHPVNYQSLQQHFLYIHSTENTATAIHILVMHFRMECSNKTFCFFAIWSECCLWQLNPKLWKVLKLDFHCFPKGLVYFFVSNCKERTVLEMFIEQSFVYCAYYTLLCTTCFFLEINVWT